MAWNDQQGVSQGSQDFQQNSAFGPAPPTLGPTIIGTDQPAQLNVPNFPTTPAGVSQQAVALGSGTPAGPLPLPNQQASLTTNISAPSVPASDAASLALQSEVDNDADDIVWVNRAKRIIAGTRGDPHRQVQLLQQLSVVYLKERYGRSVHADEV